jgi:hypothetical protein
MSNYTITPITVYRVQSDGRCRDVSSMKLAEELRDEWDEIDRANKILDGGGTLGLALAVMDRTCPAEIAHLTQNHGIQIRHWQCGDYYAYAICHFNERGDLYVSGVGGWSGWYGQTVNLVDLARYPNRLGVEKDPRAGVK